jgi:hypothetical protein
MARLKSRLIRRTASKRQHPQRQPNIANPASVSAEGVRRFDLNIEKILEGWEKRLGIDSKRPR